MILADSLPLTFLYYSLEDHSPSNPTPWLNISYNVIDGYYLYLIVFNYVFIIFYIYIITRTTMVLVGYVSYVS